MILRSPLHEEHLRLGAKMTPFGGWEMPLTYAGVLAEHTAVRDSAGLFDVSHLGKVVVTGSGAAEALDLLLPGRVKDLELGRAAYNLLLNQSAGIVDDLFVYRRPDDFLLVPNAANTAAALEAMRGMSGDTKIIDSSTAWALLALSGPNSPEILRRLLPDVASLKLHRIEEMTLRGIPLWVARTGYTGEYTVELFVPGESAAEVWRLLLEEGAREGIRPAGLGCRDTLRLEMGYPLHGHDITVETNPIEASLDWVIRWEKDGFVGREALERVRAEGPLRKLIGLVGHGREIPREGYPILADSKPVGAITSGNFSPTLRTGIALGYVPTPLSSPGTMLEVQVRNKRLRVEVVRPPFIKSG